MSDWTAKEQSNMVIAVLLQDKNPALAWPICPRNWEGVHEVVGSRTAEECRCGTDAVSLNVPVSHSDQVTGDSSRRLFVSALSIQRACASRAQTVLPHCRSRWEELVAAKSAQVATVTAGEALPNLLVSRIPALRSCNLTEKAVL